MAKDTSILTIPNDMSYLPIVGAYVRAAATQLGFDDAAIGDIRLAVDEACAHVIETAFEPGEEQNLTISCQRYPSGLRVTIADKGMPFDPHSIAEYDARGGLDQDLSGLPFYLMQQAMDEVRFVNKGWEGKELQLTKYLEVPGVESYFTEEELRPYDSAPEPAPPGGYMVRLMEPDDAVEIARCIYKTYGYTYPGESIYFPDRVVTMNQSGEMISALAVTEAGEVIGHCSLTGELRDRVMEIGQAVVVPAHRGRGVIKDLIDLLMEEARQRGLAGLFAHAVTIHPFSQRVMFKYGFRESAILLGYAHRHVQMKEFADQELPQRETVIYGYQSLDEESRHPVFPPVHHQSIIARIYQNLGLERKRVFSANPRLRSESGGQPSEIPRFDLTTRMVSAFGSGLIEVASYGPGIEQEIKNKLRGLCREGIAVVYLNLPIRDPQTAVRCQRFEELGFFFSGIQPRPDGKDLLCLQTLSGPGIDYDLVQIYSDFGKELLGYVREQDPLS
jgi:anti-sigma regulatory factor (Ser/Thr protein kinase)/RimJ/RimL family protein N-acetyltransferase